MPLSLYVLISDYLLSTDHKLGKPAIARLKHPVPNGRLKLNNVARVWSPDGWPSGQSRGADFSRSLLCWVTILCWLRCEDNTEEQGTYRFLDNSASIGTEVQTALRARRYIDADDALENGRVWNGNNETVIEMQHIIVWM